MSLIAHDGMRGPYVKRLWFYIDPRRGVTRGHLAHQFWQMMQVALSTMTELKDLLIHDPAGTATWILDPDEMRFQLHTAKFRLQWDDDMVAFLQSQHQLKHLQTLDAHDITRVVPLPEGHLRELESFEGPLLVAAEMLSCPSLSHLRIIVDEEVFQLLPQFVENIVTSDLPLRSLHVNVIPDPVVEETLEALTVDSKCCARIQHLGVIMMPWIHVSTCSLYFTPVMIISSTPPVPSVMSSTVTSHDCTTYKASRLKSPIWILHPLKASNVRSRWR